jgi:ribosome recycling factor
VSKKQAEKYYKLGYKCMDDVIESDKNIFKGTVNDYIWSEHTKEKIDEDEGTEIMDKIQELLKDYVDILEENLDPLKIKISIEKRRISQ